jgi:NAD(P)-dependent dehydrogenase (short-subunit alcohol dehydrogenase family)
MDNHLAIITGAGRGIGRAIAVRLAHEKIPVVLIARSSDEITELRNQIVGGGGQAWACPCDITSVEEVNALVQDILEEIGTPTILVNNAGIAPSAKLEETTNATWRETFAVNVDGPFYLLRALLPAMKEHGGHIISVASTAALEGFRFTSAYTASKHALLGLMRALAAEYEKSPLVFSTLCPGFTRTAILEASIQSVISRGKSREEAEAAYARMNREGKIIEPEGIAQTVIELIEKPAASGGVYHADGMPIE